MERVSNDDNITDFAINWGLNIITGIFFNGN